MTLTLVASDAGDGNDHDFVVWQRPRLVAPGRPDLLLRDVRQASGELVRQQRHMVATVARCLAAAADVANAKDKLDVAAIAQKQGLKVDALRAWLAYLGVGTGDVVDLAGHFKTTIDGVSGYAFIQGWGSEATPLLVANSSDQQVRIPGNMKPHSVAVHPSPTLLAAIGWRSPLSSTVRIEAAVKHAHPECGNGVTWSLELRRGATRRRLATGTAQGGNEVKIGPIENLPVQPGDVVSLLIGPRDGNHACDLTAVDLKIIDQAPAGRTWNLADDISADVLAGNPHADRFGNAGVWHFYAESVQDSGSTSPVIPAGSLLAQWQAAENAETQQQLAAAIQKLLSTGPPAAKDHPDSVLYQQLTSLGGPLLSRTLGPAGVNSSDADKQPDESPASGAAPWGLDPALFGKHPDGSAIDAASLCVPAPAMIEFRLPAELAAGCELVATGLLDARTGAEGSVQLQIVSGKPAPPTGLTPSTATVTVGNGVWTDDNRKCLLHPADSRQPGECDPAAAGGGARRVPTCCFPRRCATPRSFRWTKSSRSRCCIARTINWSA